MLRSSPVGFIPSVDLDAVAAALAPRLLAYATARIGSREAAEDVAQDALTALVRRWRLAGPPESPDAFAFAIARRRAGRVVAKRALLAPIHTLRHMIRDEASVDQAYEDRRELAIVRSALRALSRADREALLLRTVGELSFEEIAAISRTSTAAIKMRISRARRRLAALLPEDANGRRTRAARG